MTVELKEDFVRQLTMLQECCSDLQNHHNVKIVVKRKKEKDGETDISVDAFWNPDKEVFDDVEELRNVGHVISGEVGHLLSMIERHFPETY